MPDVSPRIALPLLAAGQAQKELFHNEALTTLDALVLPVFAPPQDAPPTGPAAGSGWIVGTAPSDAWTGMANALAIAAGGGWTFVAPRAGMVVQLDDGRSARWTASAWSVGTILADEVRIEGVRVLGSQHAAIAAPSGGATVDAEARATLDALLGALRDHGLIAT